MALTRIKTDQVLDGTITNDDLASDIALNTSGNITTSGDISVANVTLTGELNGPATFYIDPAPHDPDTDGATNGLVVIRGDLQVDGTTTTVNSTTVEVADKNIVLGANATADTQNDGAGITVSRPDSTNAKFTWDETNDQFKLEPGRIALSTSAGTDNTFITNLDDGNLELLNKGRSTDFGAIRINRSNDPAGDTTYFRDTEIYDGKGNIVLFVDGSEGKVGVGTNQPAEAFSVKGDGYRLTVESNDYEVAMLGRRGSTAPNIDRGYLRLRYDGVTADGIVLDTGGDSWIQGGYVGIGTSSPDRTLHVTRSDGTGTVIKVGNTGTSNATIEFVDTGTTDTISIGSVANDLFLKSDDGDIVFATTGDPGTASMTVQRGGNVGIGTSDPVSPLEISTNNGNAEVELLRLGNDDDTFTNSETEQAVALAFALQSYEAGSRSSRLAAKIVARKGGVGTNDWYTTGSSTNFNGQLDFYTRENDVLTKQMTLNEDGKLGIGTDDPQYTLHVDGSSKTNFIYFTNISNASQSDASIYWSDGSGTSELTINADSTSDSNIKFFTSEPAGSGRVAMWMQGDDTLDGGQSTTIYGRLKLTDGYGSTGAYENSQVRHSIRPSLNLDFANSKQLDPRITFYRDSIATYYDSKGVLRYANENEPRFDHDPATGESKGLLIEEARENIALATTLEVPLDFNAMFIQKYMEVAPDGTYSGHHVLASPGVSRHEVNVKYSGTNGVTYTISIWIKPLGSVDHINFSRAGGSDLVRYNLTGDGSIEGEGGNATGTIKLNNNGWYKLSITYQEDTTGTRSTYMSPGIGTDTASVYTNLNGDGENGVAVWGAQVEEGAFPTSYVPSDTRFTSRSSEATYHDENGTLKRAPANAPRYGYKYDGRKWVKTGLILEGAATNLYSLSDLMDLAVTGSTTDTPKYATAPDGSKTALRIVWNNGYAYRYYPNIHGNGVVHTHSFYIKPISGTSDARHAIGGTPGSASWTFNFDSEFTEQVGGNGTTYGYTYEKLADGWWRVSVTFSLPNSTGYVELQWSGSGGGVEYYLWGMQIETGYAPTSFIYTDDTSGGLTRSADVASSVAYTRDNDIVEIYDAEDLIGQEQGTVFTEWSQNEPSGGFGGVFELWDSGTNGIDQRTNGVFYITNNYSISYGSSLPPVGEVQKTALAYDSTSVLNSQSAINGTLQGLNTVHTWNMHLTKIRLGSIDLNTAYQLNGHLARFRLYSERLTNEELKALTEND